MQVVLSKKKNKKPFKKKCKVFFLCCLVFIFFLLVYYFQVVCPIVVALSKEKVLSISTSSISEAVEEVLTEQMLDYSDIVTITYSGENKVSLIEVDTVKVNMLIREITQSVQAKFDTLSQHGVGIALGTFSGIPFLYGIGPEISVQLVPVGTVNTKVNSIFNTAGINQTLHRLYFVVSATLGMVLPANTQSFITELEVLICESVIIGEIPQIYLPQTI